MACSETALHLFTDQLVGTVQRGNHIKNWESYWLLNQINNSYHWTLTGKISSNYTVFMKILTAKDYNFNIFVVTFPWIRRWNLTDLTIPTLKWILLEKPPVNLFPWRNKLHSTQSFDQNRRTSISAFTGSFTVTINTIKIQFQFQFSVSWSLTNLPLHATRWGLVPSQYFRLSYHCVYCESNVTGSKMSRDMTSFAE
jgi:hypothetical protein